MMDANRARARHDLEAVDLGSGRTVRPFGAEADAEACAGLMAESEPWRTLGRSRAALLEALRRPGPERYLAEQDGRFAGFLVLNLQGAFVGYLQTIAVAGPFRGRGLGSALVAFAEARIFRDHPNVFLCVSSFNPGRGGCTNASATGWWENWRTSWCAATARS